VQVVLQVLLGRQVSQVLLGLLAAQAPPAAQVLQDLLDPLELMELQDNQVALVPLDWLGLLADKVTLASLDHRASQVVCSYILYMIL